MLFNESPQSKNYRSRERTAGESRAIARGKRLLDTIREMVQREMDA